VKKVPLQGTREPKKSLFAYYPVALPSSGSCQLVTWLGIYQLSTSLTRPTLRKVGLLFQPRTPTPNSTAVWRAKQNLGSRVGVDHVVPASGLGRK
jgi:hypothetical protein